MLKGVSDLLYTGGVGEDIFGETYIGRIARQDHDNKYLLTKMLREYIKWHEKNARFYDNYDYDKKKLHFLGSMKYAWAFGGFCFAGTIINPNFTSKSSFYMRKFNVILLATIGYAWGRKKQDFQLLNMMLKMHDYLPLEIKRALQDKDFRHVALFDWEQPGRKLFDDVTGKSLS